MLFEIPHNRLFLNIKICDSCCLCQMSLNIQIGLPLFIYQSLPSNNLIIMWVSMWAYLWGVIVLDLAIRDCQSGRPWCHQWQVSKLNINLTIRGIVCFCKTDGSTCPENSSILNPNGSKFLSWILKHSTHCVSRWSHLEISQLQYS